jgi:hypothetical protein
MSSKPDLGPIQPPIQRVPGREADHSPLTSADVEERWIYGLELWGCASKSSISIIQRSQSKILRMIVDAPWYVSNATLHADLGISYVHEVIHQKRNNHHTRLETHENPLLKQEKKTDDSKETGQLTWFELPGIRRWNTPHQDIVIITTLAYRM